MESSELQKLAIESLVKTNETLTRQIAEMSERMKEMSAQIAWFQRQMFGRKSEKHVDIDKGPSLFDAAGVEIPSEAGTPADDEPEPETETITYERKKGKRGVCEKGIDISALPVLETRVLEPQNLDLTRYRKIGEEITTLLGFKPGYLFQIKVVRPKYGLIDSTEPVERGKGVLIAPLPKFPIYKGMPDASLLAEILLQKYEYHMPFYRQIKQMAHLGVTGMKEATMAGWYKRTMELLKPLYELLVEEVFSSDYVQADESTVPVINNEKHQTDKEYLWMARSVMEKNVAFFYDQGSRAGDVIKQKTDKYHFRGHLQCDGFGGYTAAYKASADVRLVNCLVHIRRHFEQALSENRKPASWFLGKIRELYHIEHECDRAGMFAEQRLEQRHLKSKPLMEEMKAWLENEGLRYSERSLIGKAVTYAYTRWDNMMRVLEDGRLLLDNNLAENEIRPITLGRKNYLFCGNHDSAENMCVIQSLLATCRNHDVNPRIYLNSVIESMPYFDKASKADLRMLLPAQWKQLHPEGIMKTPVRQLAK